MFYVMGAGINHVWKQLEEELKHLPNNHDYMDFDVREVDTKSGYVILMNKGKQDGQD